MSTSGSVSLRGEDALSLLIEQRDLCRQLAGLSDAQRALITGNEPERLMQALASRQTLLDRMTAVGSRLQPYQQDWRAVRSTLNGEEARRADSLVAEVHTLLQQILQKDEEDGKLLSARKGATAGAMTDLRSRRQAGAAYSGTGAGGASREWTET